MCTPSNNQCRTAQKHTSTTTVKKYTIAYMSSVRPTDNDRGEGVILFSYDVTSNIGPSRWGTIPIEGHVNQCDDSYKEQSGINIDTSTNISRATRSNTTKNVPQHDQQEHQPPYEKCDEYYHPRQMFHIGNCTTDDLIYTIRKNRVVQVQIRQNKKQKNPSNRTVHNCIAPYIQLPSQSASSAHRDKYLYYDFVQLHTHIGSEHSLNHQVFPAEMHIVHRLRQNITNLENYKNQDKRNDDHHSNPKELLVVGMWIDHDVKDIDVKSRQDDPYSTTINTNQLDYFTSNTMQTYLEGWQAVVVREANTPCVLDNDESTAEHFAVVPDLHHPNLSIIDQQHSRKKKTYRTAKNGRRQRSWATTSIQESSLVPTNVRPSIFNPYTHIWTLQFNQTRTATNDQYQHPPRRLYSYPGSLTTPPCTEDAQWFIVEDPMYLPYSYYQRILQFIFPPSTGTAVTNNVANGSDVSRTTKSPKNNNNNAVTKSWSKIQNNEINLSTKTSSRPIQSLNNRTVRLYCPMNTTTTTTGIHKISTITITPPDPESVPSIFVWNVWILILFLGWLYCYYCNDRRRRCHNHQQHRRRTNSNRTLRQSSTSVSI